MCGIVGVFSKNRFDCNGLDAVKNMMAVQKHRGPDDDGICSIDFASKRALFDSRAEDFAECYFGFNRLSIRDTSFAGHQPMAYGSLVLIFNGEIYNADDLRNEFLQSDSFNSTADTEVILHLCSKFGFARAVKMLDGMFALALADIDAGRLYIARDRVGIKPLYVYEGKDTLLFASELKSIIATKYNKWTLDRQTVQETILFGYAYVRTLVSDVSMVRPGQYLELDYASGRLIRHTFWDAVSEFAHTDRHDLTQDDLRDRLWSRTRESVDSQLVSDVSVGCQLSGGIDSTLVCGELMRSGMGNPSITNFGVGVIFKDGQYSEETYMDQVATSLGMECKKIEMTTDDVIDNLETTCWHLDTIPGFCNELGIFLLAKAARSNVTVLLSGEGSDELFYGYRRLALATEAAKLSRAMNGVGLSSNVINRLTCGKVLKGRPFDEASLGVYFAESMNCDLMRRLFSGSYAEDEVISMRTQEMNRVTSAGIKDNDRYRCYELIVRLPALLNRQDKMTMAFSIENRVPFLSNALIEQAIETPFHDLVKFRKGRLHGKDPFKEMCAEKYGESFAYRKKSGFSLPLRDYLCASRMSDSAEEAFGALRSFDLMDVDYLRGLYAKLPESTTDEVNLLWRTVSLGLLVSCWSRRGYLYCPEAPAR